jgi:hypothetical protein
VQGERKTKKYFGFSKPPPTFASPSLFAKPLAVEQILLATKLRS